MSPSDHPSRPLLRPDLLAAGLSDETITAAHRRSNWHQIRPGASLDAAEWQTLSDDDRHRLLVQSTLPRLGPHSVISHTSAARLHGLPVWPPDAERDVVHVYRNRTDGGYRKGWVNAHVGVLDPHHTSTVGDVSVTSIARTVIDCATVLDHGPAVALADQALRRGVTTQADIADLVRVLKGRKGITRARAALVASDGRSESVGESLSRVALAGTGLPAPTLQYQIRRDDGSPIARTDFAWPKFRTIGEFDGKIKYGRLLRTDEAPGDAVWREKLREDAIRDMGWEVVRWTWAELAHPGLLAERILRAFRRGARLAAA